MTFAEEKSYTASPKVLLHKTTRIITDSSYVTMTLICSIFLAKIKDLQLFITGFF